MPEPPQDLIKVFCRGLCGKSVTLDYRELYLTIKKSKVYRDIFDFCDSYVCDSCETEFIIAVETADIKQLTISEQPHPQ